MLGTLYIIGITAESMTGALAAGRRSMDLFGVVIIGCCTALGGGSMRNILLGHYPLTWVAHPNYILITTAAALLTVYIFARYMQRLRMLFLMLDALGLIVFTIIGTQEALNDKHPLLIASIAGIITGVFGGILRDILCNQIPLIFRKELYASVSLMAGWLYILLKDHTSLNIILSTIITLLAGFSLRMLSVWFHWEMPKFEYSE
ncbi:MAG: trimeric intracellular cation channel family protein [Endozoicomonadaceae bacterium]|nr:trimeric intracellular cation channel family protein [Endozoicomonadaceae bacterium]